MAGETAEIRCWWVLPVITVLLNIEKISLLLIFPLPYSFKIHILSGLHHHYFRRMAWWICLFHRTTLQRIEFTPLKYINTEIDVEINNLALSGQKLHDYFFLRRNNGTPPTNKIPQRSIEITPGSGTETGEGSGYIFIAYENGSSWAQTWLIAKKMNDATLYISFFILPPI